MYYKINYTQGTVLFCCITVAPRVYVLIVRECVSGVLCRRELPRKGDHLLLLNCSSMQVEHMYGNQHVCLIVTTGHTPLLLAPSLLPTLASSPHSTLVLVPVS